jgi:predicted outer membrane repeat protein
MTDVGFHNNTAFGSGGGMYNDASSPDLLNVVFSDNVASHGGGMYNFLNSHPVITNALFKDNSTTTGNGGAIHGVLSDPTITNATFEGNTSPAGSGGALYHSSSNPSLVNTIVWGNVAPIGSQIHNVSGAPWISFSLVEGSGGSGPGWDPSIGIDGGGNVDADPLFVDAPGGNLRLATGSPAIDTGNSSAPNLPVTDLDGSPRVAGVAVDMGAYEFDLVTAVDNPTPTPGATALRSIYPNPFNPSVTITFELDAETSVEVAVYDVRGSLVRRLVSGRRAAGPHRLKWDGTNDRGGRVASGVYLVQLRSQTRVDQKKIVLIK